MSNSNPELDMAPRTVQHGVRIISNSDMYDNPRHTCLKPMKAKERMQEAVVDHSLHKTHVDRFRSLNLEVHDRGIKRKSGFETLSDY